MSERDTLIPRRLILPVAAALTALLLFKFLWPLFVYDSPLGYDPGFYRYLFLRHASAFPPFVMPVLEPWAKGHPLGLFFFTTIFMRLGVPVDWLIGWIWNIFPVVLAVVLAFVMRRRHGDMVMLGTLLAALMSVAYFDGFAAMYWKTLASLLWCVLAFDALERKSFLAVPYGILTVATHHQTGLLFGLVFASHMLWQIAQAMRSGEGMRSKKIRDLGMIAAGGMLIVLIGVIVYLPVWQESVLQHLPALLGKTEASSGSFPPASFYLRTQGILLLLAALGFGLNIRRERLTVWQLAVLWSLAFVVLRMLFYRRFFLQLDFFLLPFAGIGIAYLVSRFRETAGYTVLGAIMALQLYSMTQAVITRTPIIDDRTFGEIVAAADAIPGDAFVLGLENSGVVVMRGWMPDRKVGGPGLFDVSWDIRQWETFLLGSHQNRVELLRTLPQPVYMISTGFFRSFYGPYADAFLRDPCFEQQGNTPVYRVTCVQPAP